MKLFIYAVIFSAVSSYRVYGEDNKFTIGGEGKIRFRYVEASKDTVKGTYGETLQQGLSFKQRLDLSLNIPLTDYISVNGVLRISNEDSTQEVLPPPDFISTKALAGWWSLNFVKHPFGVDVGSYDASFTPLTFMRWDLNDNPLGASGCGCCQVVGGISGESLEEPGEDYKLEGIKTEISGEHGDVTLIFARPQVGIGGEAYAQYMYGTRGRLVLPFITHFSTLNIGGTYLSVRDDTTSITHLAPVFPFQSDVWSFDVAIPIWCDLSCVGEYAKSTRDNNLLSDEDSTLIDEGFMGGFKLLSSDIIDANLF